jgi:hypothetical protein
MANRRLASLKKAWGEFVGPEATAVDTTIALSLGAVGALVAPTPILRLAAADLWGGVWANNTRACARWYARPGQTDADYLKFAAAHIHPGMLAWTDRNQQRRVPAWLWATATYGYLLASTVAIRRMTHRRRLLGATLTAGGVALDAALGPSRAAPWFAPVFYSKLLLGHASSTLWPDSAMRAGPTRQFGVTLPPSSPAALLSPVLPS